jgi:signal transduction histidine kinase
MRSLRQRVFIGMVGGTTVVVTLAALLVFLSYRSLAMRALDQEMQREWPQVAFALLREYRHANLPPGRQGRPSPRLPADVHAALLDKQGRLVVALTEDEPPDWQQMHQRLHERPSRLLGFRGLQMPLQLRDRWRERGWRRGRPRPEQMHSTPEEADHYLLFLVDLDRLQAEFRRVRFGLLMLVLLAVGLAMLGAWGTTALVLTPLRRLATTIGELNQDRGRLLPAALPPDLRLLPERLNELLDRIESVRSRERQFTAGAAHELRTPLAGLRVQLELVLLRERDGAAYRDAIANGLRSVDDMARLVDGLLQLARLDAGHVVSQRQAVAIRERLQAALQGRLVEWDWQGPESVLADPQHLDRIIDNVMVNIRSHAHGDGPIRIQARWHGDALQVRISNPAVDPDWTDAEQAFAAFWRGDASRRSDRGHAGLGLALIRGLQRLGGGEANASWADGRFVLELTWPVHEDVMRAG